MSTQGYPQQQYQYVAPQGQDGGGSSSSSDRTLWIAVLVIVVLVASALGWAIARAGQPSWNDAEQQARFASQQSMFDGREQGFAEGRKHARRQAQLEAELQRLKAARLAQASGYEAGLKRGRQQAASRQGGGLDEFGLPSDLGLDTSIGDEAYPSYGMEDTLTGADLLDDAPGFAPDLSSGSYGSYYGGASNGGYGMAATSGREPGFWERLGMGGDERPAGY